MPLIWAMALTSWLGVACSTPKDQPVSLQQKRFNGVSLVSPPKPVPDSSFDVIKRLNANWVAIIPFGFIGPESPKVHFNVPWQWWGEKDEGVSAMVSAAHARGIDVMLKPHVWIRHGAFTGDYDPGTEEGWQELESSYYDYILHFARLADSLDCGAFCIGTEWRGFHQARPAYWASLIDSVRATYPGELTYAGNWDSYQGFPHWDRLDYIGVDAYFPISDARTPTVKECEEGWQTVASQLEDFQLKVGKPVIFTEYGYRSAGHAAMRPWEEASSDSVNLKAQENAYRALYNVVWDRPWFAGGFLWKWHLNPKGAGGIEDTHFTPQGKPVEYLIRERYGKE